VNQVNLPVPRLGGGTSTTAIVFEVLRLQWYLGLEDMFDVSSSIHFGFLSTATNRVDAETTSLASMVDDAEDPLTIGFAAKVSNVVTTGAHSETMPIVIDMTDGDGNGILIATDRIFIVGGNLSGTVAATYVCNILYRMVEVGIQEYVGIVQSQQ